MLQLLHSRDHCPSFPQAARGQLGSVADEIMPYNSRHKSCSALGRGLTCQCVRRVSWDFSFGIIWRSRMRLRQQDEVVLSCLLSAVKLQGLPEMGYNIQ